MSYNKYNNNNNGNGGYSKNYGNNYNNGGNNYNKNEDEKQKNVGGVWEKFSNGKKWLSINIAGKSYVAFVNNYANPENKQPTYNVLEAKGSTSGEKATTNAKPYQNNNYKKNNGYTNNNEEYQKAYVEKTKETAEEADDDEFVTL